MENSNTTTSILPGTLVAGKYVVVKEVDSGKAGLISRDEKNKIYLVVKRELFANSLKSEKGIKVVRPEHTITLQILSKDRIESDFEFEIFKAQLHLSQSLCHPHIVQVLDVGKLNSDDYYGVVERVDGTTCKELIREEKKGLPISDTLYILYSLSQILDYSHKRNIPHLGLCPDVITIGDTGQVKLTGFGIGIIQTRRYWQSINSELLASKRELRLNLQNSEVSQSIDVTRAVELFSYNKAKVQDASKQIVDYKSDIYSFGQLAIALYTGKEPAQSVDPADTIIRNFKEDTPNWFSELCMRCTELEPDKRPTSMEEINHLLHEKMYQYRIPRIKNAQSDENQKKRSTFQSIKSWFVRLGNDIAKTFNKAGIKAGAFFAALSLAVITILISNTILGEKINIYLLDLWQNNKSLTTPKDVLIVSVNRDELEEYYKYKNEGEKPFELLFNVLEKVNEYKPKQIILDQEIVPNLVLDNQSVVKEPNKRLLDILSKGNYYLTGNRAVKWTYDNLSSSKGSNKILSIGPSEPYIKASKGVIYRGEVTKEFELWSTRFFEFSPTSIEENGNIIYNDYPSFAKVISNSDANNSDFPSTRDLLNYYGPSGTIPTISVRDIFADEHVSSSITSKLKDKIVYIDYWYPEYDRYSGRMVRADAYWTPVDDSMGEGEYIATMVQNLIDKDWIKRFSRSTEANIIFVLAFAISYLIISVSYSSLFPILISIVSLILIFFYVFIFIGYYASLGGLLFVTFGSLIYKLIKYVNKNEFLKQVAKRVCS